MRDRKLIKYEFGSFSQEVPESERQAYIDQWKSTVLKQNGKQPYRDRATLNLLGDAFQESAGSPMIYFATPKDSWDSGGKYNGPTPSFEFETDGSDLDRGYRKEIESEINHAISKALRNKMPFLRILSAPYEPDHAVQLHLYFQDAYQNFDGDGKGGIVGLGTSSLQTEPHDMLHYGGESVFRVGDELDDEQTWMWKEDRRSAAGIALKKAVLKVIPKWNPGSE